MPQLRLLSLKLTRVADLAPLAGLASLRSLILSFTPARDLAPLAGLTGLESLYLTGSLTRDLAPLAGLTNLTRLDLGGTNCVVDAACASSLGAVHLAILDGHDALYVEKLSGHQAVHVISRVGGRLPLHATGVGLVLLAFAPADLQEDYLASPLTKFTPLTQTDPDALRRRLAEIRATGVARMSEEMTPGSSSLAAPILDRTGLVVAAVSVVTRTTPTVDPAQELAVRQASRGSSRTLGYRRA